MVGFRTENSKGHGGTSEKSFLQLRGAVLAPLTLDANLTKFTDTKVQEYRSTANLTVFDIGLRACREVKKGRKSFPAPGAVDFYGFFHLCVSSSPFLKLLPEFLLFFGS